MCFSLSATSFRSRGSLAERRACTAISNSEYTEPSAWVHCEPVLVAKSSANCFAVVPSNVDLYGLNGLHHTSVAMLLDSAPRATASLGNSITFATVASFGFKPCCAACFQYVWKSGGIGAQVNSSAPDDLNLAICALKSEMPS